MVPHDFYLGLDAVQIVLGLIVLGLMIRTKELKTYWPMLTMAMWQAPAYLVLLYVRHLGKSRISPSHAYNLYFFTFWPAFGISAVCAILLTYTIFDSAMQPLKGLQTLGRIMYRWAACISLATALSIAISPQSGRDPLVLAISQFQRVSAVLILSMMIFVALAIKPMGLSIRSRVFGVSVGTLVVSATSMMQATYLSRMSGMYNPYALIQMTSSCVAEILWIYYFSVPEPKRKFILLPTTSPFHHWNRIAELLGSEPGYVAIGGVAPDVFAGAEIDVFRRASAKMQQLKEQDQQAALPGSNP